MDRLFWAKVQREGECWRWIGCLNASGYGSLFRQREGKGRSHLAHRYAYELLVGPIPEGLQLDHLCRNRACVRPTHLEPVTNAENQRRGFSPWGINARKTHCPKGHELTPGNTCRSLRRGVVHRKCRICANAAVRRYKSRLREMAGR